MIREAKLNTLHMYDNYDKKDKDYPLWKKIAEYMNGEIAFVLEKGFDNKKRGISFSWTERLREEQGTSLYDGAGWYDGHIH